MRKERATEFELLLACYRSGQVSERQWQEHLRDREFREWVENQLPINYPSACSGRDIPGQEAAVPDRTIVVRESEWREMREALEWYAGAGEENAYYIVDENGERLARFSEFASRARAALAKLEVVLCE